MKGVSKHFGGLYALNHLDLHVETGEIVSVIGPNGAGKSTVFNVITGLYRPNAGDITFGGQTAGMNPRETLELRDHIVRMRDVLGLTVLLIEHDMRVVKGVSDRVVACDYGQKIAEGTYEEVANDEHVIEAYLGTKAVG